METVGDSVVPACCRPGLARHVFAIYGQASWGVKRVAMETLLKRLASVEKESLVIVTRPGKSILGPYRVGVSRKKARPYDVVMEGYRPDFGFDGSCSCPDYRKNTLRFCKHLATAFSYWLSKKNRRVQFERALNRTKEGTGSANSTPRLSWVPPTGLFQVEDPLQGLCLVSPAASSRSLDRLLGERTVALALPNTRLSWLSRLRKEVEKARGDADR